MILQFLLPFFTAAKNSKSALILLTGFLIAACNQENGNTTSAIIGTYRAYSDDPVQQQFLANENQYLKLGNGQVIEYHSTINGKTRFHFKGEFTFDASTNDLHIRWQDGKLPEKLNIEKTDDGYIIRIGETLYKKE